MLALLLFGLSGFAASGPVSGVEVCEAHYVMGTLLEITLVAPDRPTGQRWIRAGVTEARRLDGELTSWSSQSALSRLNAAAGKGVQTVPADVLSGDRALRRPLPRDRWSVRHLRQPAAAALVAGGRSGALASYRGNRELARAGRV